MNFFKILVVLSLSIFSLFLISCQKGAMQDLNIEKQIDTPDQEKLYKKTIKTDKGDTKVKMKIRISQIPAPSSLEIVTIKIFRDKASNDSFYELSELFKRHIEFPNLGKTIELVPQPITYISSIDGYQAIGFVVNN